MELDLHHIDSAHEAVHQRLINWARYVRVTGGGFIQPMWKQGKSSRQWDESPHINIEVDTLDGHIIEQAVYKLPPNHRSVIRWWYCFNTPEHKVRRELACTHAGLALLVREGRGMLLNRST